MLALFAVGVVTGTILSFELGLLWPDFMATFGCVFGLGFALEGFSFFLEAIFIADLRLRLGPPLAAHAPAGGRADRARRLPGSLMVIAVNGWMNHPSGFRLVDGKVVDVHPWRRCSATGSSGTSSCTCTSPATSSSGFVRRRRLRVGLAARALGPLRAHRARDPAGGRRARRAGAGPRRRLGGRDVARTSRSSSRRSRASARRRRARPCTSSAGTTDGDVRYGIEIPRLLSLLAKHDPNATVERARRGAAAPPAAGQRRALRVPDDGRDRDAARALALVFLVVAAPETAAGVALVLPGGLLAGPLSMVALFAGWVVTEVGGNRGSSTA